jgi:hypothetical protein
MRRVVWGQLNQDGSVRPDLNKVGTGLFCRTHDACNVSLGDASRAAGHFDGNRYVGNSSFPKNVEVGLHHPATSFFLPGTKAPQSLPVKRGPDLCR